MGLFDGWKWISILAAVRMDSSTVEMQDHAAFFASASKAGNSSSGRIGFDK
jgi:hypothetical protein